MRHRTDFIPTLVLTTGVLALGPAARATQVAYEGFGPSFPTYANGGSGFSGPWAQGGFNAFASGYVLREHSLEGPRLQTSGGSVFGAAFPEINGAIRNLAQPVGFDDTVVYLSFVLQPEGHLNNGVFNGFFGLTLNGSFGGDVFFGKPGGGAVTEYVVETRGGSGQVSSGVSTVVGCSALLVVKAEFLAGNDVFTLYVNPPGDHEPAGGAVKADQDLGIVSRIGIYSTGSFVIDEIRLGTAFADVVPIDHHRRHADHDDDEHCRADDK